MLLARATFPIATATLVAIWLAMLIWGGPEFGWDRKLLARLHVIHDPGAIRWLKLVTELGGWIVLALVGIAAAIALAVHRRRRAALLLIILFGGRMLVEVQKLVFGSPRPPEGGHLVLAESLGYPSAHAANSMMTYMAVALLVPVLQTRRAVAVTLALLLAGAIGLTRVMLGVHWPSDVIGGWAFGLLWIIVCVRMASVRPEPVPADGASDAGTSEAAPSFSWRRRLKNERPGAQRPGRDGQAPR